MLTCSICLYTGRHPTAVVEDPDGPDDIVIMNGQSVCTDHAGYTGGNTGPRHAMIMAAVRAAGFETLSALQTANAAARR